MKANAPVLKNKELVDWFIMKTNDMKEIEALANLGVLSLFVQRGSYTGIIYQREVNHHHQPDIGNYTKKDK